MLGPMRRRDASARRLLRLGAVLASLLALFFGTLGRARAETLQAPIGGRPIALGSGRVACGPATLPTGAPSGWLPDPSGRTVRPPFHEAAVGQSATLKIAADLASCLKSSASLQLLATRRRPFIDAGSVVFFADEGRVEARGRRLQDAMVAWRSPTASGSDVCRSPRLEANGERCVWNVGRNLSAATDAKALSLVAAGARVGADVTTYDANGNALEAEDLVLEPAKVVVNALLPDDAALDLSTGRGEVDLTHPEVVAAVDCAPARCEVIAGKLQVRGLTSQVNSVDVKVRLLPQVFWLNKDKLEAEPALHVPVLHCPMSVVSGPPLRNTPSARLVVRLEGGCARDPAVLRFGVGRQILNVLQSEAANEHAFILLELGATAAPSLTLTAVLADDESVVAATTRVETRDPPGVHASLSIPGHANLDFIPTNRAATVHARRPGEGARLVVLPVADVYEVDEGEVQTLKGDANAAGLANLRFGYRVPALPGALGKADLAVLIDPVQRSIHEANLPAPLALSLLGPQPLVELVCGTRKAELRVEPGDPAHLPFRERDNCRLILHRERLKREYGTQKLNLSIDVFSADGNSRGDARVAKTTVLRAGPAPLYAWIHGVVNPFDRLVVRLSHAADETHYIGANEIDTGAPEVKWTVVFGTGKLRLYATTAIPTGLYRFGDDDHSGVLSLNFGIVSRLTWLDSDGHEGFLGLEAGVMAIGLTNDVSTTGHSLTQVGLVGGLGVSVPIANRSSAAEAAISLHGWVEQDISNGSGLAFIFGPSISIGNIGTNL